MSITIRRARHADAALLARLNAAVQQPHHEAEPKRYKPVIPNDPSVIEWFAERLAQDECVIYIAESSGEAVGYAVCLLQERGESPFTYAVRRIHVDQIAVLETHHRSGVGTALLDAVIEWATAKKARQITLGVKLFNEGAIAFYQRNGFRGNTMTMEYDIE
jgi:ribosomal protein S18 acetylase RimI-like enzyme